MSFLASTNLITDLKFKQKVGVKADAHIEALAVINQNDTVLEEQNLQIKPENRQDLQINVKLFLKNFNADLAFDALQTLKKALGKNFKFFDTKSPKVEFCPRCGQNRFFNFDCTRGWY